MTSTLFSLRRVKSFPEPAFTPQWGASTSQAKVSPRTVNRLISSGLPVSNEKLRHPQSKDLSVERVTHPIGPGVEDIITTDMR